MINSIMIVNLIKSINQQKLRVIVFLMIVFTILLCFCKDEEFGGLIALHKRLDEINRPTEEDFIEQAEEKIIEWYEFIFDRLYFVLVTSTTVGYGDVVPKSLRVRTFTFVYLILVFMISLS